MTPTDDCDALFLAPHPDDAEIFCGGTILRLAAAGSQVAIVDMTRGEMGTWGNAATRRTECEAATQLLGVAARTNLEIRDTRVASTRSNVGLLVGEIRKFRPRLMFVPHERDVHPDHTATASVARRAFFLSGLARYEPGLGAPYRPSMLIQYPGNDHVDPSFCVDISDFVAQKQAVVECYASQMPATHAAADDAAPPIHFAKKLDPMTRSLARDHYFGSQLGVQAAEPFIVQGPLLVTDLRLLFGS